MLHYLPSEKGQVVSKKCIFHYFGGDNASFRLTLYSVYDWNCCASPELTNNRYVNKKIFHFLGVKHTFFYCIL